MFTRERWRWRALSGEERPRRRAHGAPARRASYGLKAESIAALILRLKGYTILARRFVVNGGEIDLIARRGGSIAFVEVKARADLEVAAIAISAAKRRRIARAARVWLTRNPWAAGLTLRGDAIFVAPRRLPRHAPDAYRLEIDSVMRCTGPRPEAHPRRGRAPVKPGDAIACPARRAPETSSCRNRRP